MSAKSRIEALEKQVGATDRETVITVDWSNEKREPEPGEIIIEWDQAIDAE